MGSDRSNGNNGAFTLDSPEPGWQLLIIASDEGGWEHVSAHAVRPRSRGVARTPNWREMCLVKDTFWDPEDCVLQFHPPRSVYVNMHPHVLHLWRQIGATVTLPPSWMVGPLADET